MRVLEILERDGSVVSGHKVCYAGENARGETSFNGEGKDLFLLPPGGSSMLPSKAAGFVLPRREYPEEFFFSAMDCILMATQSDGGLPALQVKKGGFLSVSSRARILLPIKAGVLTVSDKGSAGERTDISGPALVERLSLIGGVAARSAVVADEMEQIITVLSGWADDEDLPLILCTGGTGFSNRDVTPEALDALADKKVPGIGEAMRAESLKITPMAMLSRANAVLRGETLIISLPGSVKAAVECFDAIAPALRHGIEILRGLDGECGG